MPTTFRERYEIVRVKGVSSRLTGTIGVLDLRPISGGGQAAGAP